MKERLSRLCNINAISGREKAVTDVLYEMARPFASEIFYDVLGNLFVFVRGRMRRERPYMMAAHCDEVGLMVKGVTENGCVKFGAVGGILPQVLAGKGFVSMENGVKGVIASTPPHLRKNVDSELSEEDMYLDFGFTSKSEAKGFVRPGDAFAFDEQFSELNGDLVCSKALDNRAGCLSLLLAMEKGLEYDTWFVFTVREEVGLVGARVAAERIAPALAVAVDTTTAGDTYKVPAYDSVCRIGEGTVIVPADRSALYIPQRVERLCALADSFGIKWQFKEKMSGGVDAGSMQIASGGTPVLAFATPCRYIHSSGSVISLADLEQTSALVSAVCSRDDLV